MQPSLRSTNLRLAVHLCTLAALFFGSPAYPQTQSFQDSIAPDESTQKPKKEKLTSRIAYQKPRIFIEACTPLIDEVTKQVKALNRFEIVDQVKGDGSHLRIKCKGGKASAELLFYPKQFNTDGELPGIVVAQTVYQGRSIRRQARAVSKRLISEILKKAPWQGEVIDFVEIPFVDPKVGEGATVTPPDDPEFGEPGGRAKTKKMFRANLSIGSSSELIQKPCQPVVFGTLAVDLLVSNVLFAPLGEGIVTRVDKTRSTAEVLFVGKVPRKEYPLLVTVPAIENITESMVPLIRECEKLLQPEESIIPGWLADKLGVEVYGVLEGVGVYVSWIKTDDGRTLRNIKTLVFENDVLLGKYLNLGVSGKVGFFGEDQTWEPRVVEVQNKAEMFTTMVTIGPKFPFGLVDVDFGIGATFDNFNNPYERTLTKDDIGTTTVVNPDTGEEETTTNAVPDSQKVLYRKNVKVRPTFMLKLNYEAGRYRFNFRNAFSNGFNGYHFSNEAQGFYGISRTWYLGAGMYNYKIGRDSLAAPGLRSLGLGLIVEVKI